jgi:PilZ domain
MVHERRASQRRRTLKTAHIILSERAPKIECAVRNMSNGGAKLVVSTTYGIPDAFQVRMGGILRACHTVWKTETEIGIAFD